MRSVVVVFPASMCAMMPMFRYCSSGVVRGMLVDLFGVQGPPGLPHGPRGKHAIQQKRGWTERPLEQGLVSIRRRRVRSPPAANGDPWRAEPHTDAPTVAGTIARRRVVLRRLSGASAPSSASAGRPAPPPVRAHKVAGAQLAGVGIVGYSGRAPAGDLTSLTALCTSLWNVVGDAGMSMPPRCLPPRDATGPESGPLYRHRGTTHAVRLHGRAPVEP